MHPSDMGQIMNCEDEHTLEKENENNEHDE